MSAPVTVSVNGRRTRVRVEGHPASPPVLLLHGIGRSIEDWALQFPRLAGAHRIIALDLPGFGFSARTPEPTTLRALARGVLDTLDSLHEQRPLHVIGNSLGGAVALQLLSLDAHRVASLVLSNGAGFGSEVAIPLRLMAIPVVGELMTRRTTRGGALLTERFLYADRTLASKERIEHALAIAGQPDPGVATLELARDLGTRRGIKAEWRTELIAAATRNARPTLILWGDRDRILPAHHLDAARRLIPHAQTRLFAGVGHMPQIECPDEFAASVLTFLADVDMTAPADPERPQAHPPSA